jgi:DNA polymerase-3 subunit alpha
MLLLQQENSMNRAQMLYALDDIIEIVKSSKNNGTEPAYFIPEVQDLTDEEKMNNEYDHLGFFISNHPLDSYRIKLSQLHQIDQLAEMEHGSLVHMGGLMMDIVVKQTKKGAMMAFFTLEDSTGRCEVIVFPRTYKELAHFFETKNSVIELSGKLERQVREFNGEEIVRNKIILTKLKPMEHARKIEKIALCVMDGDNLTQIKEVLDSNPGDVPVEIDYAFCRMKTPIKVDQTRNFLMDLEAMCNIKKYYAQ